MSVLLLAVVPRTHVLVLVVVASTRWCGCGGCDTSWERGQQHVLAGRQRQRLQRCFPWQRSQHAGWHRHLHEGLRRQAFVQRLLRHGCVLHRHQLKVARHIVVKLAELGDGMGVGGVAVLVELDAGDTEDGAALRQIL